MSITVKPIFIKDNNEFPFKGQNEERGFDGANHEYRFIVDTLRRYFGDEIDFEEENGVFTIPFENINDLDAVKEIYENTGDYFEGDDELESAYFRFEVIEYKLFNQDYNHAILDINN